MSAGKITLVPDPSTSTVYLFYISKNGELNGFVQKNLLLPPLFRQRWPVPQLVPGEWVAMAVPANPDGSQILQVRAAIVPRIGGRLLTLLARDNVKEQIWWVGYDLSGDAGWSQWATATPAESTQDFDMAYNVNYPCGPGQSSGGLVVPWVNGNYITGILTFDGTQWGNIGFPNNPGPSTAQYTVYNPADSRKTEPAYMPFPPTFSAVAIDNNYDVRGE